MFWLGLYTTTNSYFAGIEAVSIEHKSVELDKNFTMGMNKSIYACCLLITSDKRYIAGYLTKNTTCIVA